MSKKRIYFVTFASVDSERADRMIARLKRFRPNAVFIGRQEIGFDCSVNAVREEIDQSSATIVLVGRTTFDDQFVQSDIAASRQKEPPNEILLIALDEEYELPKTSETVQSLEACGTELALPDGDLGEAIDRLILRASKGEQIARTANAPNKGSCPR